MNPARRQVMLQRGLLVGAAFSLLGGPLPAQTPASPAGEGGVVIDHKAVGCIVAGKFPKMNACFSPNSAVARARVYFRA